MGDKWPSCNVYRTMMELLLKGLITDEIPDTFELMVMLPPSASTKAAVTSTLVAHRKKLDTDKLELELELERAVGCHTFEVPGEHDPTLTLLPESEEVHVVTRHWPLQLAVSSSWMPNPVRNTSTTT